MPIERFPAEVADVLREAGWWPGRRTDTQTAQAIRVVCDQLGRHGARIEAFDAAVEALTEFGGLYVIQDGPGRDLRRRPFALDPTQVVAPETLADLARLLDTKLFPLGMEGLHDSILAIDHSGRVFALDHAGDWYLGNTIDNALITLITGTQPIRLSDNGHWTETPADPAPVIFYIYSHKDERLKDRLDAHLSSMQRENEIQSWHDRRISPGADWATEIDEQISQADIVLILVSADFIASDYCWGVEFAQALDRHARGEAIVIPLIVRPVDWQNTALGRLQALPRDGRAVTTWANRDEAWTDVAKSIRSVVREIRARSAGMQITAPESLQWRGGSAGGSSKRSVEFAHIGVTENKEPRWDEFNHEIAYCPFRDPLRADCDRYFHLRDFITNADLFFDVVILNSSNSPVVLSAVGVTIEEVAGIPGVYGIPKAAKIPRATDEYVVIMPNLRGQFTEFRVPAVMVNQQVWTRLPDPIYLPARAPYRYLLRLKGYQQNILNHARLRLVAEAGGEAAKSQLLHVFTW